jgi:hypothetical protein
MRSVYPEHELKLLVVRTCVMLPLQERVVVNLEASTAEPLPWSITSGPLLVLMLGLQDDACVS